MHKFNTKITFDNHYINKFLLDVDKKRLELHKDKESIFPLTRKERRTYIKPSIFIYYSVEQNFSIQPYSVFCWLGVLVPAVYLTSMYVCFYGMFVSMLCLCLWYACVYGMFVSMVCLCLWYACVYGMFVSMVCLCLWCVCVYGMFVSVVYLCLWYMSMVHL